MSEWEEFTRALGRRGFAHRLVLARPSGYSYFGSVSSDRFGEVGIELHFPDNFLLGFPRAYIAGDQATLQAYRFPHLGQGRQLCFEDGSIQFERHDAEGTVAFILEAVQNTLNLPPEEWDSEIFREFKSYWDPRETFLTEISDEDDDAMLFKLEKLRGGSYLVGAAAPIFQSFSERSPFKAQQRFQILEVEALPSILYLEAWPPQNLVGILAWVKMLPKLGERFRRAIRDQIEEGRSDIGILLRVRTPSIRLGIRFSVSRAERGRLKRLHRYPEPFWNALKGLNPVITRGLATPLDFEQIFSRNHTQKLLFQDLRLFLVGTGTIGSNLAPLLLRAGAGIGKKGLLALVDKDIYTMENFPRHRLGTWAFGIKKADALEVELKQEAPFSNVKAFPFPAEQVNLLPESDLVIDATGDLEMMRWFSRQALEFTARHRRMVPLLSFWVHGAGDAVCAFWQSAKGGACQECLRMHHEAHPDLYPPVTGKRVVDGCHSVFTPFAMDVSMQAATLAYSALRRGLEAPDRASFLLVQPFVGPAAGVRLAGAIQVLDLPPNPDCPACGPSSIPD